MSFKDPYWPDERPKTKMEGIMVIGAWFVVLVGCVGFWVTVIRWFLK